MNMLTIKGKDDRTIEVNEVLQAMTYATVYSTATGRTDIGVLVGPPGTNQYTVFSTQDDSTDSIVYGTEEQRDATTFD